MGLFNSRSAAASSCWLLMGLALQLLLVQAIPSRYVHRGHHMRRISHPSSSIMQIASPSLLHPIGVSLLPGPILKFPPPPKKFAYATFAPIPASEDLDDPVNGFIKLVLAKQPLYPPAPYRKPTQPTTTAVPTTEISTTVPTPTTKIYVRLPPKTAKPYVRPVTFPKAIKPKTTKPRKNTFFTNTKITKATPAPTTSTAAAVAVAELDPIDDIRVVPGGEMMKLDATKVLEPVISDVTAPVILTVVPAVVPLSTTELVPTEAEPLEEVVKAITPVPLSFSSFQPYPRPFYRPAIYTRPPFRPHLHYTLLPKSTEAPDTSEVLKSNVDESLSLPTSTETEPEIVTEKEEPVPAPFDDFEMFKVLSDVTDENEIPVIDEEPKLSELPDLPPVFTEAPVIVEDTEVTEISIIVEDDPNAIEDIETVSEEPKVLEVIPNEPTIVEDTEEPIIVEDDQKAIEVIEIVPEEPNVFKAFPNEPEILEIIPDEPIILDIVPDEPEILEILPQELEMIVSIPAELAVIDVVRNEAENVEIIPQLPSFFEDVPREPDVFESELVEPQKADEEAPLQIENEETAFDSNISEIDIDIPISTEETDAAEVPEIDFEMVRNSEDVIEAVLVSAEVPSVTQEEFKPELIALEIPETLEVSKNVPVIEEEIIENTPIIELLEAQEIVTAVETQPFKRSHKYEPVWNIHTFGHGDKNGPPRSQSFPGWPELSSTTRRSHDYPTWLQSTTSSPFARNNPDWPQDITTHRGYVFSKWSPKVENVKKTLTVKPINTEAKTLESTIKKSEENTRLNNLKNVRKSRKRYRTSTVKPTTRRGTMPNISKSIKSTTIRPLSSSLFPTWDEIVQTRKASRERTSSESRESNSGFEKGFGTGIGTGFGFGDWGTKI